MIKVQRGQKVWEYDLENKTFREAEFTANDGWRMIERKPNHIYCVALNHKNADRKFIRMITKAVTKIQKQKI